MTNLIASIIISLTTNVSEKFPEHMVTIPSPVNADGTVYAMHMYKMVPDENPTNKTIITTCERITKLKVKFEGQDKYFELKREVLWETGRQQVLEKKWSDIKQVLQTNKVDSTVIWGYYK